MLATAAVRSARCATAVSVDPSRTVAEHGVERGDHLTHHRHDDDLRLLSSGLEAIVECFEPRFQLLAQGNMCGTARRGADALPRSKATSRAKGSHRNLGDLVSGRRRRVLCVYGGPHWEGEEPKPMMHGHEKSDLVIVAMKPANKAKEAHCGGVCGGERSGVGGAKGGGQGEYAPAQHVLDPEPGSRDKRAGAYTATFAVTHPRWEPYAGKPHVRFCAGGVR